MSNNCQSRTSQCSLCIKAVCAPCRVIEPSRERQRRHLHDFKSRLGLHPRPTGHIVLVPKIPFFHTWTNTFSLQVNLFDIVAFLFQNYPDLKQNICRCCRVRKETGSKEARADNSLYWVREAAVAAVHNCHTVPLPYLCSWVCA